MRLGQCLRISKLQFRLFVRSVEAPIAFVPRIHSPMNKLLHAPDETSQDSAEVKRSRGEPIKFAILCMPRTGSSMLTQWLSTHKDVRCLTAIFSEAGWPPKRVSGMGAFGWIRGNISSEWDELSLRLAKP